MSIFKLFLFTKPNFERILHQKGALFDLNETCFLYTFSQIFMPPIHFRRSSFLNLIQFLGCSALIDLHFLVFETSSWSWGHIAYKLIVFYVRTVITCIMYMFLQCFVVFILNSHDFFQEFLNFFSEILRCHKLIKESSHTAFWLVNRTPIQPINLKILPRKFSWLQKTKTTFVTK